MNKFRGWENVFGFTFKQTVKKKGYLLSTVFLSAVIFALVAIAFVVGNIPEKNDENHGDNQGNVSETEEEFYLKRLLIADNSGLGMIDYAEAIGNIADNNAGEIQVVVSTDSRDNIIDEAKKDTNTAAVYISKKEGSFDIEMILVEGTEVSESELYDIADVISECMEQKKKEIAGVDEKITAVLESEVFITCTEIGEADVIMTLIKMFAPMMLGLLLYMMLILYGQEVCKEVSSEKTSKLMENLLTTIHPYGLIAGKILAVSSAALLQFLSWVVALFAGIFVGNTAAQAINPEYVDYFKIAVDYLKMNFNQSAMTGTSAVMAIAFFCIAFLFYCSLAGVAGSMVSKPEDAAHTQGIYTFPILISFFVCYFAQLGEQEEILKIARYVPFTSPFCVPAEMLTGATSLVTGIISLILLLVFSVVFIMLSARIYKTLVLYNGSRPSFKMVMSMLRDEKRK